MNVSERGHCLVSQEIRNRILEGRINIGDLNVNLVDGIFADETLEGRVQPSSFEPTLGEEGFILDAEENGVFKPGLNRTVYRALLELPSRQRQRINLLDGIELKIGFTYLIPLQEKNTLKEGERIKSSPKSSTGRVFPLTRLVSDYSPYFDEINFATCFDRKIMTWLLVQPTAFNLIVRSGDALNQLRFFKGIDVSLSQREILEELGKTPIIYKRESDGSLTPINPLVTDDGMVVNFDLTGKITSEIVALRARKNPTPIDLSKKGFYDAEEFFEPVRPHNGVIKFFKGESYLLASAGVLSIPDHLSAELRRHYGLGVRGKWDEAGFVDNGFKGDLVSEAVFSEDMCVNLAQEEEIPFSTLEFFRTNQKPDKVYGGGIGSNYQGQLGPRVSKHFKSFDYKMAAKDYKKLDRMVLTQDARVLLRHRNSRDGFEPVAQEDLAQLLIDVQSGFFQSRYDCETDESVLQPIPYVVLFDKFGNVFTYVRATNIEDYGDARLFGKHSIGLGGHISLTDGPDFLKNCLHREVMKEEVHIIGDYSKPVLVGTMMAYDQPVDRVHFGLIYSSRVTGNIRANENSITPIGMLSAAQLYEQRKKFETWSQKLIPYLKLISPVS